MKLTPKDYAALEKSFITRKMADAAGLYRVPSIEGRDLVGRRGGGDFSGIVFPYRMPGETYSVLDRLRLDFPPNDPSGEPVHKYLTPSGSRNRLYFPPCPPELLTDATLPVVITEGEKKTLALWRMALESTNGAGKPTFLPIGLPGVWSWRGTTGIRTNEKGDRVPEKGVLRDFDRLPWTGRRLTILFDANAATNDGVRAARRQLAAEMTRRSAEVWIADLPAHEGINGIDDYLGSFGLASALEVLKQAVRYEWRKELILSDKGKILGILANALTALRSAPEWCGVLAFNEFSLCATTTRETPWGPVEKWTEQDDRLCTEWMQRHGVRIKISDAASAVETVARDRTYHPVREYLDSLKWDGTRRIDKWLRHYLGVKPDDAKRVGLVRAFGAKWLISAVARIYQPGAKADHCLILEGPQGTFKSAALRILGEPWFTDDMADLGSKDAALATIGVWIIELSELDAISRVERSRVKSFMSRNSDRFRPPYGRRLIDSPRQCVFAGTVNHFEYLGDETGGRRFWPVTCGAIKLDSLRDNRDQLWAEAVTRYRSGEHWWLETKKLNEAAAREQDARYQRDAWESEIESYIDGRTGVTTAEILKSALNKPAGMWLRSDETRVGLILRRLGWDPQRPKANEPRVYHRANVPT